MTGKSGYFVGIDPGSKGGAAILDSGGALVGVARFDGLCPGLVAAQMADLAAKLAAAGNIKGGPGSVYVALEKVGAAPGQGVSSMFTFGQGVGLIKGWLSAKGFTFVEVSPQSWQKIARAEGSPKERSKALASDWGLGSFVFEGCRVPHQGAIDAAGIAEYLRRTIMGDLPPIKPPKPKAKRRQPIKLD